MRRTARVESVRFARQIEFSCVLALGALAFANHVPLRALNPRALDWAMRGDGATQVLGWRFFCEAPWGVPLGATSLYVAPAGSTLILTDSLPPIAALLRLVGGCNEPDFQYLGPWLLLCFVAQAAVAWLLARALNFDAVPRMSATLLCLCAPILTARVNHPTLCAHFLILLALLIVVEARRWSPSRVVVALASLNAFAALLHPYLMVLVASLSLVAAGSLEQRRSAAILVVVGACAAGLLIIGAATSNEPIVGFGRFQSDLIGFVDSWGVGRLLPSSSRSSLEGLCYLGLGLVCAVVVRVVRRPAVGFFRPAVWAAAIALWLFSLSTTWTLAGHEVVRADWLAEAFAPIASALRASGRLAWPLWYLLCFVGVGAVAALPRPHVALAVVVTLQLLDIGRVGPPADDHDDHDDATELADPRWATTLRGKTSLTLVPPILPNSRLAWMLDAWDDPSIYVRLALLAARQHLKINSGYLARPPNTVLRTAAAAVVDDLSNGRPDPSTAYVFPSVPSDDEHAFTDPSLCCIQLRDATVCVARATAEFPCAAPATSP